MNQQNQTERPQGEIILIHKPIGWSSFQATKKIKFVTGAKRVGHAGTLDPLASGLLIVCTEKQTKGIQVIQDAEKVYEGTIKLGITTPSYDLETEPNALFETGHITQALIEKILPQFVGELEQIPPVYSAIKVNGRRAYALARQGEEPVLKSRKISIYAFEITAIEIPNIDFRVRCSKGTYIRTLAFDFGKALESGACLSRLVRTKIGNYSLDNALTPHEFEEVFKRRNKQDSGDPIKPI